MSSLAKQLKQLQIPGSLPSTATAKASKKASLLFDSKEAADIDNETVFSLGLNGLEELKVIEPSFATFDNSLFGDTSKSLERALQSKDVNEKLDKHISKFLQYLSPYFLLKPAHKVLEWLIRRFQIHVYNVDSLLTCILPYHETNMFARVVQLLSIRDPSSKWNWLRPIQKDGVPLSKTAFLQHCISDPAFFAIICEMVMEGIKLEIPPSSSRVLFTFYTSTTVGVLDMMPNVTEKFITQLLPHLLGGLKSGLSEMVAASYMITAQLCFRCNMEENLVKSLTDSICKNLKPGLAVEGLSCLTYICQSQGLKKLSKKSFKALLKLPNLDKTLHQLSSTHNITPLLEVFVPQLVSNGVKNVLAEPEQSDFYMKPLLEIALDLLKNLEFDRSMVVAIGRTLFEEYCSARKTLGADESQIGKLNEKVKELVQALEKRYPTELEKAIEAHLGSLRGTEDISEEGAGDVVAEGSIWTMDLVSLALAGVKSQVIPDSNTTLVLSLHHPQAKVRQMAVKHLGDLLTGKEGLSEDKQFISDSLLSRLQDDDPAVVACVLKLGQVLVDNLPGDQFVDEMFKLLDKKSSEWDEVRKEASLLLVGDWVNGAASSLVNKIVFGLLPRLLLYPKSQKTAIQLSSTVSKSALATKHTLLSGMKEFVKKKEWKSCGSSSDLDKLALASSLLINWLGENLMKLNPMQHLEMAMSMIMHAKGLADDNLFHPLLRCLLGRVVSMATDLHRWAMCQMVTEFILPDLWKVTKLQGSYETPKLAEILGKHSTKRLNHAKGAITLWLCGNVLRKLTVNPDASSGHWWSFQNTSFNPERMYTKLLTSLFEVVAFGSGTSTPHQVLFKGLLQDLFECHLADKLVLLKFLGHLWCQNPHRGGQGVSALLQVQCLHIANACLGSMSGKTVKELTKSTCTVLPSLLVPLCSPISAVRNAEELSADPEQLHRILGEFFAPLTSHSKPHSKPSAHMKTVKNTLNFMLHHLVSSETPSYVKRIMLSSLRSVVTQDVLQTMLPVLGQLLDKCEDTRPFLNEDESVLLQLIVQKYTPDTVTLLQANPPCWKMLLRVLSLRAAVHSGHPAPIMTALGQISNRFFQAIPSEEVKQHLFKILVDTLLETKDVVIGNAAKSSLMKLSLTADLINEEMCKLIARNDNEPKKKKTKRSQQVHEDDENEITHRLHRVTVILELLQHKINIEEPHRLLPTLFATLSRCVELDHSQTTSEYIMQLVFSLINNICHKLSPNNSSAPAELVAEDQFDVELIVQCIRSSESPQTHNQALLLLATAAKLFPEKVLHNVMSIFTFMGASVVRQDDSYSFEVITKTLDTVFPALIQAGEKQQLPQQTRKDSVSLNDIVAMLIRVFVDASPHIPEHRQLPLFTHLISTIGSTQFLHVALILLLEKHVVQGPTTPDEKQTTAVKNPLGADFCLSLCHNFDLNVQVEAMLKLLQYIDQLPLEKPEGRRHKPRMTRKSASSFLAVTPLFDVDSHSAKHLRQFKYASVSLIPSLLNSDEFANKVQVQEEMLNSLFLRLLEDTLNFMTKTAQHGDQATQDATGKFWKALLHKTYEIVDKVNLLLPASVFFDVIKKLLHSSNGTVRRKTMELLNSKLSHNAGSHPSDQVEALLSLVTELLVISRGTGDSEESIINKQTALYSLKLLSRLLSKEHPSEFKEVMTTSIDVFSSKNANAQVASSALLCAAEVVTGLKAHCIPFLPQLMPSVIKLLKTTGKERNNLLTLCGVTALCKAAEALPHFLSPYLVDILIQVTRPSLTGGEVTEGQQEQAEVTKHSSVDAQLKDRLILLRKELACNISPRVLISAVSECYSSVVATQKECVAALMSVLAECVNGMKKDDIKTYQSNLFTLFLEALDFRVHHDLEEDDDLVNRTEGSVIDAFLCLVVKLSEASFRPMFLRLIDWATRASSSKERLLVFYRLCDSVAVKLKGLFVLFAGYLVKNCASLLDAINISKTDENIFLDESKDRGIHKTCSLLKYVLDCLHKCFMYDTHGFLDSDRFQCLMQPLVDQIENSLGGEDESKERLSNHLTPCLAQFAVASGSDAQWKPLNYQVLLKTRHSSALVRFAALKVLEGFHSRLGEDFMVLLPETIPFLAELMEDECFEVEEQCQHVISEIEQVLGEPLQKYF
ncbi:HEAT repeat-containing protein 1 [Desmophyllum pertusum]|uniref:HEAT repeat-containing protein 1 n=1 Tax=Desmophyllum pertusum TaxID=174260 RepID=A0A9W9YE13_9CNID|nr:HEAT repeat-containing protein 1 [Desmophyllum pertusum]